MVSVNALSMVSVNAADPSCRAAVQWLLPPACMHSHVCHGGGGCENGGGCDDGGYSNPSCAPRLLVAAGQWVISYTVDQLYQQQEKGQQEHQQQQQQQVLLGPMCAPIKHMAVARDGRTLLVAMQRGDGRHGDGRHGGLHARHKDSQYKDSRENKDDNNNDDNNDSNSSRIAVAGSMRGSNRNRQNKNNSNDSTISSKHNEHRGVDLLALWDVCTGQLLVTFGGGSDDDGGVCVCMYALVHCVCDVCV